MIERHFSKMSYAESILDYVTDGERKEIDYLPEPRMKTNPNARGGSIKVEAHAPTVRLD